MRRPDRGERVRSLNPEGNLMVKYFSVMQNFFADRLSGDRGATAVEYGLLVALIAGAIIGTVALLGTSINGWFNTIRGGL